MLPTKQQLCVSFQEDFLLLMHSACYGLAQHAMGQHVLELLLAMYISWVQVT